ncbi:DUF1611 domain-containing protein [Parahaliea mediterranea]|uniref:DUF1611 domain-containing protein n=1 Tax=Parahaliea mediterranea TaxID=651086 RepID=A0A939IN24_9GAMM|nr:DUF1611 domain-containing protein [Parahaliea mediterranea]MBN7798120.1 DUF1611 domain-containing protein [Parahaliea mediterranea]
MKVVEIRPPYLIFLGSESRATYAKTGAGLAQWRPELCSGQLRLAADTVDLGLPDLTLEQAAEAGVGSLVIGTAAVGGGIPEDWYPVLREALSRGIDVVAGAHKRLAEVPGLSESAAAGGAQLVDVRVPPAELPVGTGKKRRGKRLLMVGTDCAVGKKYSALCLERDMRAAGMKADFRASGQTGIMIAGCGIPMDAVVSDFLSGAAEILSPDNDDDHWDVIEGQGGLFHPGYSSVSTGLLIGSQPDAFVVCHEAGRERISGWDDFPLPSIEDVIARTVELGVLVNPAIHCVGVCVNTSSLAEDERKSYLAQLEKRLVLPCVDPLIDGAEAIVRGLR